MFCNKCWKQVPDDATECEFCGSPITAVKPVVDINAEPDPEEDRVQTNVYAPPEIGSAGFFDFQKKWDKAELKKDKFSFKDPASIFTLLGILAVLAGIFLPITKIDLLTKTVSVTLMDGKDCYFHFGVLVLLLIFLFKNLKLCVFLFSLGEAGLCYYSLRSYIKLERNLKFDWLKGKEIGFYLLLAGAVVLIISGFWQMSNRMKDK